MRERGFTLIEILVAVLIASMAMVAVSTTFVSTLRTHYEIDNLTSSTADGQRILTLLERDLRGLWHQNIKHNRVLIGRHMDPSGYDEDRIDFLTTTDAIGGVIDNQMELAYPSICEVGYWLKRNEEIPGLLELWRREDPLVDEDILTGGHFQLVSDRLKSFSLTYYETIGVDPRRDLIRDWDSSREGKLPRVIKIEFTLHRRIGNRNEISGNEVEDYEKTLKPYVRHIVFDKRYTEIMQPGVAMVPVAPMPPGGEEPEGPVGGGGPAGPAGPAGPGGPAGLPGGASGEFPGGVPGTVPGGARPGQRPDQARPSRPDAPPRGNQPPIDLGDLLRGAGGGSGGFPFGGSGGR